MGPGLVDEVRAALRGRPESEWRQVYDRALEEAYRASDFDTLARLAMTASVHVELEHGPSAAVAELDHAFSHARLASGSVQMQLLALRAQYEALDGRVTLARQSLAEARSAVADGSEADRLELEVNEVVVECIALGPFDAEATAALCARVERTDRDWLATSLRVWAIPRLFASAGGAQLEPWVDRLGAAAQAAGHEWRTHDAIALRRALRRSMADADLGHELPATVKNYVAVRTEHLSHRYRARAGGADGGARTEALSGALSACSPEFRQGAAWLTAEEPPEAPPESVTLVTLPLVLAAAERVALEGTQRAAAEWLEALRAILPGDVVTCLEWPVCVERVRALLACRMGDVDAGIRRMRRAVRAADGVGLPLEGAIARVQLATLLAVLPSAARRREWERVRAEGNERCRQHGLRVEVHVASASSATALGRFDSVRPSLRPREVEVLALLKQGLTYKAVGERLGISWRTAQRHAHNSYQKLGVSSRVQAIEAARELGLM